MDNSIGAIIAENIESLQQLYDIQTKDAPSNVILPYADKIYDVNLNTREIHGPEMLGAQRDHKSEIIYFKVDRYFDYMDLANTICVIEYILPGDKSKVPYIYVVPFYDTSKFIQEGKMIIPWALGGAATSKNGLLEYAIRFYRVSKDTQGNIELVYNLNTLPTRSLVKKSLDVEDNKMIDEYDTPMGKYESLIQQLVENKTTWMIL